MIESADMKILDACTKLSHWLQKLTGLTNYFIAKIGIGMTAMSIIVMVANYFHQFLTHKTNIFFVVIVSIYMLVLVERSVMCDRADKEIQASERVLPNITLVGRSPPVYRMLWIGLCLFDMGSWVGTVGVAKLPLMENISGCWFSAGLAIFYYFVAVDPLPPGKSKVREWFEKFKFSFGPKPEAVPAKN